MTQINATATGSTESCESKPLQEAAELLGKKIVVDTDSNFVYLGVLETLGRDFLCLSDADAHDTGDAKQTKENYIHEARRIGVRPNRRRTFVRLDRVLSLTCLDDIIKF
jgi:small nuclear ribonucleoprotein (snRNP)-like protein